MFRLNFAIDGFKRYGWKTVLTTARDWKVLTKCDPSMVEGNALIIDNKSLYSSFNDSGYLLKPLELKVFGDKAFLLIYSNGFICRLWRQGMIQFSADTRKNGIYP